MKQSLLLALFSLFVLEGFGQIEDTNFEPIEDTLIRTRYGIEVNHFFTGSGFSMGTEILVSVIDGSRNLNVGFFYCNEARRISGIIAHHEVSLVRNRERSRFKPYAFYNGIYRISKVTRTPDTNNAKDFGIYKTFEHHLGFGLRTTLTRNMYLSSALGYGVYFGSVKKPVTLPGTGEMAGSNGFSPIAKIGFGVVL